MILSVLFPVLLALLTLPFTILRIILLGTTILQLVFQIPLLIRRYSVHAMLNRFLTAVIKDLLIFNGTGTEPTDRYPKYLCR